MRSGSDDRANPTRFPGWGARRADRNRPRRKWTPQQPPPAPADPHRTEPIRGEVPPWRRDNAGESPFEPGSRGYERYNTAGHPRPSPPPPGGGAPQPPPPGGAPHPPQRSGAERTGLPKLPRKITVTRVAAFRSRQLTGKAVDAFHRATKADGADKSGLTSLTYATMLNYASDAAMAVALANTLFFAAATEESRGKVALYLLVTIAPFALIAPVIGPALDRIQHGRRVAMCVASLGQALMCLVMAMHFDGWLLYPAALGKMVLSKSFMVLKAAVTPRVLPPEITLSKTNARLTVFGLAAGAVFGLLAIGLSWATGSAGALWFTAAISVVGAVQAMRIPAWVEVTEGEVPAALVSRSARKKRQPMGRGVVVALWGNGTARVLTGFLMLFAAFAVKAETESEPAIQLLLLGIIGGAAGAGSFLGNAIGSRLHVGRPDQVIIGSVSGILVSTVIAAMMEGVATAAIVALVGATGSALAKISLDAVIQQALPEESRASAFGRSETVLQLAWCFGGAIGLLLPPTYWIGFVVVSVLVAIGLTQTVLVRRGSSLIPGLGTDQPVRPRPQGPSGTRKSPVGPRPSRHP
ncbi:MAG: MFS transporter [Haloechinothrix sp.]